MLGPALVIRPAGSWVAGWPGARSATAQPSRDERQRAVAAAAVLLARAAHPPGKQLQGRSPSGHTQRRSSSPGPMNAALRFAVRLAVLVGFVLAFLYYRMELRAATETHFDALNEQRRKFNEARPKEPPPMRTDM